MSTPLRVVVLASGTGSLTQALLDHVHSRDARFRIVAVCADVPTAPVLDRARASGVPAVVVDPADSPDRTSWDIALTAALDVFTPDLVVSAGFMRIIGATTLAAYGGRIINSHPALLPAFPGAHAVRDALAAHATETGATVHLVDAGVDTGPVLRQVRVEIRPGDTEEELHERIKVVERRQLIEAVDDWAVKNPRGENPMTHASSNDSRPIRRALISVYDKTGLTELATGLHAAGVTLVSTGSTAARIAQAGVPVTPVEELTGFPECLDGRVKTLHPRVHAGILADLRKPAHAEQLAEVGVEPFDLVVVNLYPFRETVAAGGTEDEVVEQIDIGGPSMVRAAAKNHPSVAVVVDPAAYGGVLAAVAAGGFTLAQRRALAATAFAHTASYDVAVATWFAEGGDEAGTFPAFLAADWTRQDVLRYGENPHQTAALYTSGSGGIAGAEQVHGKAMSYNNYVDLDAAWRAAHDHDEPAVAIIKHANPCGIAIGPDIAAAHAAAHACDPLSAYGGVIATNRPLTVAAAEQIAPVFTEVVAAPDFEDGALEILQRKKNVRLLRVSDRTKRWESREILGGLLVQDVDRIDAPGDDPAAWRLMTGPGATETEMRDLIFAWRAIRAVKSNAILLARDGASVGVGMGQVNRVDSCRLAVERARTTDDGRDRADGAVAASDAYFPFPDGLKVLIDAGVTAVVEPGGSIRDDEVITVAAEAGISLYFTDTRHFFH